MVLVVDLQSPRCGIYSWSQVITDPIKTQNVRTVMNNCDCQGEMIKERKRRLLLRLKLKYND